MAEEHASRQAAQGQLAISRLLANKSGPTLAGNRLAILFPQGRIPAAIIGLMSGQELKELSEE